MHDAATIPTPLETLRTTVRPEWIDYNGHMNVAYYVLAFDQGTDALFDFLGLGESYRARTGHSLFAVENHIVYAGEVKRDDPIRITTQVIGHDDKRLHFFHRMYHATEGYLAATSELLGLHIDLTRRRAAPFPAEATARLTAVAAAHAALPRAAELGRVIGLKQPMQR